jgi:hypothetical protein
LDLDYGLEKERMKEFFSVCKSTYIYILFSPNKW